MVSVVDGRTPLVPPTPRAANHPGPHGVQVNRPLAERVDLPVAERRAFEDRLGELQARIDACAGPQRVTLVAVTKGFGSDVVAAALDAGLQDLGENYAQELVAKAAARDPLGPGVRWHFLGALQTNKASRLAPLVSRWHGIDREAAGRAIAGRSPGAHVFVEVNVAGIDGRPGCAMGDTEDLVATLVGQGLDVRGLMTVAPKADDARTRQVFRRLAVEAQRLGLEELSMGMSDDFEIAIDEGATTVRLGRALFGPRPGRAGARQ